ncbi:hypothetical protein BTA35_0214010 [Oceanospirillum linum]|uniref:Uncharacterized protein n=1 Tax=Oceanospirillum linum TaxID=966 RepID=A0A1T1H982_OCELI|nr:hypothetical protein BTA35_0214010 [Oceanospirillum linum]
MIFLAQLELNETSFCVWRDEKGYSPQNVQIILSRQKIWLDDNVVSSVDMPVTDFMQHRRTYGHPY